MKTKSLLLLSNSQCYAAFITKWEGGNYNGQVVNMSQVHSGFDGTHHQTRRTLGLRLFCYVFHMTTERCKWETQSTRMIGLHDFGSSNFQLDGVERDFPQSYAGIY